MPHASTPPVDDLQPPRARPWVAFVVAAALIAIYAMLLVAPAEGANGTRRQLHSAVVSLTSAIKVVEASYADGDLLVNDRHLGLPASAAFCAHLRLQLPDTGHARLSCRLDEAAGLRGMLVLKRSPLGAWHCEADFADPQLLPVVCTMHTSQ